MANGIKIKIIKDTNRGADLSGDQDDEFPFKLEADFYSADIVSLASKDISPSLEEIIVLGADRDSLERFARKGNLKSRPRLLSFTVTGPDGVVLERLPAE